MVLAGRNGCASLRSVLNPGESAKYKDLAYVNQRFEAGKINAYT